MGLTAGASAPEILVREVIDRINALGAVSVRKMDGIEETVKFPLPGLEARRLILSICYIIYSVLCNVIGGYSLI